MNLIGLDIGTTTMGGVLYSPDEGKTLKTLVRENKFLASAPGEYLQDPRAILGTVRGITDELIDASPDRIGGISLSAQMHGILYVDREGEPVSPYYTWQNRRGLAREGDETLAQETSRRLGYPVHTGYGIVTHRSLSRGGEIPGGAVKFCNIGDYVCMALAGGRAPVTDITLGASLGIADIRSGTLSESLVNLELSDLEFIPEIVPSTRKLGTYRGIPVIQPIGDNQASFMGSVKERDKSLLLNYGTAGQISFYKEEFASYPHFETRPLGNEGFLYAAFSLCGGKSYAILGDFFTSVARLFSPEVTASPFKIMDSLDLDFSADGMACLPLFLGERGREGEYAFFRNITDRNFTPENMVKALVQGMAVELHRYYGALPPEVTGKFTTLVGAGNGIRRNPHLITAVERLYGKPLSLLDLTEESCLGAAINGGKGAGLFRDYREGASRIVRYGERRPEESA